MAYTGTLSAGGPGNFVTPNSALELEGVAVDMITVDFINSMIATNFLYFTMHLH